MSLASRERHGLQKQGKTFVRSSLHMTGSKAGFVGVEDAPGHLTSAMEARQFGCSDYLAYPSLAVVCVGSAFLTSIVFGLWAMSNDHVDDWRHWARRDWVESDCHVLQRGVEYAGDCLNTSASIMLPGKVPPKYNYTSCFSLHNKTELWCQTERYMEFRRGRRLGMRHVARARIQAGGNEHAAPVHHCRDFFVPWALVALPSGDTACAFPRGLAKNSRVVHLKNAAVEERADLALPGETQRCWWLGGHPCAVVAIESPATWPHTGRTVFKRERLFQIAWLTLSGIFGAFALLLFVAHLCLRYGCISSRKDGHYAMELVGSTDLGGGAETSAIKQQWQVFKAELVAEAKEGFSYQLVPTTASGFGS